MLQARFSLPIGRVALLAEGVDRNLHSVFKGTHAVVALLAEGVDRNPLKREN